MSEPEKETNVTVPVAESGLEIQPDNLVEEKSNAKRNGLLG